MANTIETMSPEEILRGIIDGSLEELVDENITMIKDYRFRSHNGMKVLNLPNLTDTYGPVFSNMNAIEHAYLKKLANPRSGNADTGGLFRPGGTVMHELALPSYVSGINLISNRRQLTTVDLGTNANRLESQSFDYCTEFDTLIIRRTDAPMPIGNPGSWTFRGTKFMSGGYSLCTFSPCRNLQNGYELVYALWLWKSVLAYRRFGVRALLRRRYSRRIAERG